MKLKTFQGKTMAETLDQVKRQFGRHAVILNTRTVSGNGLFGIGARDRVEITAARKMEDLPPPLRRGTVPFRSGKTVLAEGAAAMLSPGSQFTNDRSHEALLSEVGSLKSLVQDLVRETRYTRVAEVPGSLRPSYQKMVENAVAGKIAQQLVDRVRSELSETQLHDPKAARARLAQAVKDMLPTAGPIRLDPTDTPRIIALVGPTGVGKTTTIAKLAAHFALRDNRRVGLITLDTYRIAAVEQLRTYADIIDVPLDVVMSPKELQEAVARRSDRDVIFIDTAGRSQRDARKNEDLLRFFTTVQPHEVHLVLAGTGEEAVLKETIRRFRQVGVDRIIFTKLDEAIGFGVILSCLQEADARLSYVTTGQDVPQDIRVGESEILAELILGERSPPSESMPAARHG